MLGERIDKSFWMLSKIWISISYISRKSFNIKIGLIWGKKLFFTLNRYIVLQKETVKNDIKIIKIYYFNYFFNYYFSYYFEFFTLIIILWIKYVPK